MKRRDFIRMLLSVPAAASLNKMKIPLAKSTKLKPSVAIKEFDISVRGSFHVIEDGLIYMNDPRFGIGLYSRREIEVRVTEKFRQEGLKGLQKAYGTMKIEPQQHGESSDVQVFSEAVLQNPEEAREEPKVIHITNC